MGRARHQEALKLITLSGYVGELTDVKRSAGSQYKRYNDHFNATIETCYVSPDDLELH